MTPGSVSQELRFVHETGSTNADLVADLNSGRKRGEGSWLIAAHQTAGRGRQGRQWVGQAGNFAGSTLVRLEPGDPPATTLTLVTGVAVYEAIREFLPEPAPAALMVKWSNDVTLDGRKLTGVLLERTGDCVVAGVGVNLASAPEIAGRRTAHLGEFVPAPDPATFAHALADAFAFELARWRRYGATAFIKRWMHVAHPLGTSLTVHDETGTRIAGSFAGIEPDGALRLTMADGARRIIRAGDVEAGAAPTRDSGGHG